MGELLSQFADWFGNFLVQLYKKSQESWLGICSVMLVTIVCFIYNAINDPSGAVNTFMIFLINLVADIFPSTPDEYKIGTMLSNFAEQVPLLGWGTIYEIFEGIFGMMAIYLTVKIWRFLPFT